MIELHEKPKNYASSFLRTYTLIGDKSYCLEICNRHLFFHTCFEYNLLMSKNIPKIEMLISSFSIH